MPDLDESLNTLLQTKDKLNQSYATQAEAVLFRLQQRHYERGEKVSRLLATRQRQQEINRTIPALINMAGK